MNSGPLTLGTAGHIDHGKTTLVRAITGVDTDRLPEERTRGMSIVLGYAPLQLPSGRSLSVIDVPGHERFVRTMVAGASGIDLFLMVVAADDCVMPQTIEHASVLRGLAVRHGVVAITKTDIADPEPAATQASELLPGCETVACSSRSGDGLESLVAALDRTAAQIPSRARDRKEGPVLHIDRAFSLRGHGTVVTGTLWSGSIQLGQTLALLPGAMPVRVRSLQVHDRPVQRVDAGQRVAVNLSGIRLSDVGRGDVLARPGLLHETTTLDCALELDEGRHNGRVRVHHGTRDTTGRLVSLGDDLWQLRLDRPLLAAAGDRLVIRRLSPPSTLGGGVVLDGHARRHGARSEIVERLRRVRDGGPDAVPEATPPTRPVSTASRSSPPATVSGARLVALERRLRDAGQRPLTPAQLETDGQTLNALRAAGLAVRVRGELHAHPQAVADARDRVVALIERDGAVTLAGVRDDLGISRKSTQALLEHFDSTHVTRRLADDSRVLARRPAHADA
jgi:selenocysteine-specific elongation factor